MFMHEYCFADIILFLYYYLFFFFKFTCVDNFCFKPLICNCVFYYMYEVRCFCFACSVLRRGDENVDIRYSIIDVILLLNLLQF